MIFVFWVDVLEDMVVCKQHKKITRPNHLQCCIRNPQYEIVVAGYYKVQRL